MFFVCFFFPVKVHIAIHSFDLEAVFFFSSLEKKNTAFSFIQSIFPQNVKKMNFYSKKKYDTFASIERIVSKKGSFSLNKRRADSLKKLRFSI